MTTPRLTTRIVLAYSGGVRGSAAIGWLRERYQAEVIALTVDVGQERDLEEIRERALALGAVRAHVLDRRDACAAAAIATLRAAAGTPLDAAVIATVTPPVIGAALAEVAGIEQAMMVAHAAVPGPLGKPFRDVFGDDLGDSCGDSRGDNTARYVPLPTVDVTGEWARAASDPVDEARARGVSLPTPAPRWTASRHLLCRPVAVADTSTTSSTAVDLTFADGVPVAVTGVRFSPAELLECLSLLGGRHGVGRLGVGPLGAGRPDAERLGLGGAAGSAPGIDVPAAVLLHAAYGALPRASVRPHAHAVVRLTLQQGSCTATALDGAVVIG